MNNSEQVLHWTDQAILYWTDNKVQLQNEVSIERINDVEKLLDFTFPSDLIDLYLKMNGFGNFHWNEHMFSLWSLDRMLEEYNKNDNKTYVGFCDFLINSHSFGFNKLDRRIYKCYDEPEPIVESFQDFILLLNSNDDLLY